MPDVSVDSLVGLWVSADGGLVLLRGADVGPVIVERAGRRVEALPGKPVILMDQDQLSVDGRRLRVHMHGETDQIHEPQPLLGIGRLARATAAALALGVVVGGGVSEARPAGGEPPPIEVRERPPSDVPMPRAVTCAITVMKRGAALMVHATCPRDRAIAVGIYGRIIDPHTHSPMTNGSVRVTEVTGQKVVCQALQLKQPVKARKLQWMVHLIEHGRSDATSQGDLYRGSGAVRAGEHGGPAGALHPLRGVARRRARAGTGR